MSNLTEKAAYLKGLMQGLDIDQTTKEGKLLAAMVELMDERAMPSPIWKATRKPSTIW